MAVHGCRMCLKHPKDNLLGAQKTEYWNHSETCLSVCAYIYIRMHNYRSVYERVYRISCWTHTQTCQTCQHVSSMPDMPKIACHWREQRTMNIWWTQSKRLGYNQTSWWNVRDDLLGAVKHVHWGQIQPVQSKVSCYIQNRDLVHR